MKGGVVDRTGIELVPNYYQESPPTLKKVQKSKRLSREIYSENDRLVKKLFRAIQDGDINYVSEIWKWCAPNRKCCDHVICHVTFQVMYLFGWDETVGPAVNEDLCHPLCQCDRCSKLRKVN